MDNFELFTVTLATSVLIVFVYLSIKLRGFGNALHHLMRTKAITGIQIASLAACIAGASLLIAYSGNAESKAPEIEWFTHTTLFAGIDYDPWSTFCVKGEGDDILTSNFGIKQNLIKHGDLSIMANYTHHSCVLNEDKPTYDAVGLSIEWTFSR